MPIPLENMPVVPNAVYFPQILMQTAIINGELVTSCQVHFACASVDEQGKWEMSGQNNMIYIPNVLAMDEDLNELSADMQSVYALIISILGRLNAIRKVL